MSNIHLMEGGYGDGGAGSKFNPLLIHLALLFTVIGCCISLFSVWLHWKNYRKPNQQRQVIRILWMVPIYGISTYISLVSLDVAFYVDTFRDIYEAFVIYAFFNLLLNKLGGERALIIMLHSRPPSENFFPGTLYSREIFVGDPYTFLFVKRGILQFVYVKPILAVITMILKATGNYHEGEFSWSSSYFYLTFIYNISVSFCLWCLMVFFYATKKDLTGFRPLPKFLSVKAIIFFSFWQGVVVALLVAAGIIPEAEHISVAVQDFLVCMEMVPFAIAHAFAFSYEDYFDPTVHSARMPIRKAIKDSFGVKDVMMDTLDTLQGSRFSYRSFEPSEGVPHMGSSRTSRIMAGLRYSNITTKKHWLEPAPASKFLNSSGRGMNDERHAVEDSEPLEFEDPRPSDEMEELYKASRKMEFGDYNYPVIDFRIPIWKQARLERRMQQQRGYGGVGNSEHPVLKRYENHHKDKSNKYESLGPREGCIDVVIQRGKGNYVLVDDLSDEESQLMSPSVTKTTFSPTLPKRNPTLTDVKYKNKPSASSSTPTTTTITTITETTASQIQQLSVQPSYSTPSTNRYPQQINNNTTIEKPTNTDFYTDSSDEWQWPTNIRKKSNVSFDEQDLLTGDVWK